MLSVQQADENQLVHLTRIQVSVQFLHVLFNKLHVFTKLVKIFYIFLKDFQIFKHLLISDIGNVIPVHAPNLLKNFIFLITAGQLLADLNLNLQDISANNQIKIQNNQSKRLQDKENIVFEILGLVVTLVVLWQMKGAEVKRESVNADEVFPDLQQLFENGEGLFGLEFADLVQNLDQFGLLLEFGSVLVDVVFCQVAQFYG